MKLYVGNLPFSCTEQDVRDFFAPIPIDKVSMINDRETGRPKGFGFVEISDARLATQAVADLDGGIFGGRTIKVSQAIEKPRAPSSGRGGPPDRRDKNSGSRRQRGRDSDYE